MSDRETLAKQLQLARRARDVLREQKAGYGTRVPVDLELELEAAEVKFAKLDAEVARLDAEYYRQRSAELEREVEKYWQCDREKDEQHQQQVSELEQQLEQARSRLKSLNSQHRQLQQEYEKLKAVPTQPARSPQPQPPKLESDRGVDYTRLRDLLAEGKWKEADQETYQVMLKAAKREGLGLRGEDIDDFPCSDLRTIDRLWVDHSGGRFGFSVQSEIYRRLGGTRKYNLEVWLKFADEVGWRVDGNWVETNFSLQAVEGHLPIDYSVEMADEIGLDLGLDRVFIVGVISSLAWRTVECSRTTS